MSLFPSMSTKAVVILAAIAIACLLGGSGVLAYQYQQMRGQLDASTATVDSQTEQLQTAAGEIHTMTGQLQQVATINRQLVDTFADQQRRLDAIDRHATALAVKLEATTHEDPDAKTWGDTLLPAAVARLLDNTAEDSAGADLEGTDQPQAGGVPAGNQRTEDQSGSGAGADRSTQSH